MKTWIRLLTLAAVTLSAAPLFAQTIVSQMGGLCLNAERGIFQGARVIMWPCNADANERFQVANGRLTVAGFCATAEADTNYGRRKDAVDDRVVRGVVKGGDITLQPCSPYSNKQQNFSWWGGGKIGHNSGYILNMAGGWPAQFGSDVNAFLRGAFPFLNQKVTLWDNDSAPNALWRTGALRSLRMELQSGMNGEHVYFPGVRGTATLYRSGNNARLVTDQGSGFQLRNGQVISNDGGSVISNDGGSVVATGGGN